MTKNDIPQFCNMEYTDKVQKLFEYIKQLEDEIKILKDENARLKGVPSKPKILPQKIHSSEDKNSNRGGSDPGVKKAKTSMLIIHKEKIIEPEEALPQGSIFKGYQEYVVQDIEIKSSNTLYKLSRWEKPDGKIVSGSLPVEVIGHFGTTLRAYMLYQHNHCRVTEPILLEELREFGVDISSGQLHAILTEGHDNFHSEKSDILKAGLAVSKYIQTDDTGARHDGKNGFCTVICNSLFAYYETTYSKSRINFLEVLRGDNKDYRFNEEAIKYASSMSLPKALLEMFSQGLSFANIDALQKYFFEMNISNKQHVRILTESLLIGSLMLHGFNPNLVVLSDDAGQFNVFLHALYWIHAERTIKKLLPYTSEQIIAVNEIREQIWLYYEKLQLYKENPSKELAIKLNEEFDFIFQKETCFTSLNLALKRLKENKKELLQVLQHPAIPLHNNQSESDIREKVQRRKISVTFSDSGRKCRDTFTSLKKTCRKNKI